MRRLIPFAILGACLGVGVLPALAADKSVAIHDSYFAPAGVAVKPGEMVSWQADGAVAHSVKFDNEAELEPASVNFSASKQFPAEGAYHYICGVHAYMEGTVYVNATGTVPPAPTTSPTTSATASPTSSPGSGGSGGTPGGGGSTGGPSPAGSSPTTVSSFRVRARSTRRGVFLTVRLGAHRAVRVRGTLRRGGKRVRSVSLLARPGLHRVKLPGKALKPGRYALTLRAGNLKRTARFRVRRA